MNRKHIQLISFFVLMMSAFLIFNRCQHKGHSAPSNVMFHKLLITDTLPSFKPTLLAYQLDTFFKNKYVRGGFNASVLVTKGKEVLYSGNFGYENFATKDTLSSQSSFQLASVSKPFTATAILYLVDQDKLSLDDTLGSFFPDFPYRKITIRDLLCHRSGLPNYLHFGEKLWTDKASYMTNDNLVALMKKYPAIEGTTRPNTHFQYCNTNYALLASIVEKVSGKRFPVFMQETFFTPLGMTNTWIRDVQAPNDKTIAISYNSKWVVQKDDPFDGVYGDKGLFSSAKDMYKWNLAFYENNILNEQTQIAAYAPRSFERAGVAQLWLWLAINETAQQRIFSLSQWLVAWQ
jgi:CubicO group peptidase (beta-lactamase class C family)